MERKMGINDITNDEFEHYWMCLSDLGKEQFGKFLLFAKGDGILST